MLLTGIFCFIIGAIIGALVFMQFSPEQKKARNIIKHLHEQQDEFKNYQLGVTQHFIDTSKLLNNLSDSYAQLHNHLAQDADKLCGQNTITPIIQPLPSSQNEPYVVNAQHNSSAIPPLDYAPRNTPYDKGTLNEEYGLEKISIEETVRK